jgi:hypothetical protein
MNARTWMRLSSLSWLPYLVLAVIAFALLPKPMPPNDADVQALSGYFTAHGPAVKAYVALGSVANLFLLLFVTYLASRLRGNSELSDLSSRLILAAGTAAVITEYAVLAAQWVATTPGTLALSPLFEGFVGVGMYAFALFIGAVGAGSLVTGILPRWFGGVSALAGATELLVPVVITLGIAQAAIISFALVILWIPVAGIIASRYEWQARSATEAPRGGAAANARLSAP